MMDSVVAQTSQSAKSSRICGQLAFARWRKITGHVHGLRGAQRQGRRPLAPHLERSADSVIAFARIGDIEAGVGEDHLIQPCELQVYWQRIPDFGPKKFRVIADKDGWASFIYWGGTWLDGKRHWYLESDRVSVDEDLKVSRYEIHCDLAEWMELAAFVNDADPNNFTITDYMTYLSRTPGNSHEMTVAHGHAASFRRRNRL